MQASKKKAKDQKITLGNVNKKAKIKYKNVLCKPFEPQWPNITVKTEQKILAELVETLEKFNLKRPTYPNKQKHERKIAAETFYSSLSEQERNLRRQVVCGVNEVTKKLERDELDLVLVNKGCKMLTNHLIQLAAVRNCKAAHFSNLDKLIHPYLNVTQLSCFGFRKINSTTDDDSFQKFISFAKSSIPEIHLPWLDFERSMIHYVDNENKESVSDISSGEDSSEENELSESENCAQTSNNLQTENTSCVIATKTEEEINTTKKEDFKKNLETRKKAKKRKRSKVKNKNEVQAKDVLYDFEEELSSDDEENIKKLLEMEEEASSSDNTLSLDYIAFNENTSEDDQEEDMEKEQVDDEMIVTKTLRNRTIQQSQQEEAYLTSEEQKRLAFKNAKKRKQELKAIVFGAKFHKANIKQLVPNEKRKKKKGKKKKGKS